MNDKKELYPRPIAQEINKVDIPHIMEKFINLSTGNMPDNFKLSKKHNFYSTFQFYLDNKNNDWNNVEIPDSIISVLGDILHILHLEDNLKEAYGDQPMPAFLRWKEIETLCVESMIVSNYCRWSNIRNFAVRWLSPMEDDPPDIQVYDIMHRTMVDIEVKIKESGKNSTKDIFKSLKSGRESLAKRGASKNPAIVAVHLQEQKDWSQWFHQDEVKQKLEDFLGNEAYLIVSGVVFSGGDFIEIDPNGSKRSGSSLLAIRSKVASHALPRQFPPFND